jgi:hypothetical protein
MKFILYAFLILNTIYCISQSNGTSLEPIYFHSYYKDIEPLDSNIDSIIERDVVYGPYNHFSKSNKIYSKHRKYQLKNNKIISIDIFSDTTILYREYIRNKTNEYDTLINFGELKIDLSYQNIIVNQINVANQFGEDSLVFDSLFLLVQNGTWNINIDSKKFENGLFENGLKVGKWNTYISEYYSRHFEPYELSQEFINGKLINESVNNLVNSNKNISNLISGEWYNIGNDITDLLICKSYKCSQFFTRDSTKLVRTSYSVFDYMNLNQNQLLIRTKSVLCGVGLPKNDPNKKIKWKIINKNGIYYLNLDGEHWKIEYLTKDELIISNS